MRTASYCGSPGSAYPWSSVKRYIHDNQGLVRRMYGDEKHSAVLLNEIDTLRYGAAPPHPSGQRRSWHGRAAKAAAAPRRTASRRRQPRPQLFPDDDDPPATIFRVVTETSIKVGGSHTTATATSRDDFATTSAGAFSTSPPSVTSPEEVSATSRGHLPETSKGDLPETSPEDASTTSTERFALDGTTARDDLTTANTMTSSSRPVVSYEPASEYGLPTSDDATRMSTVSSREDDDLPVAMQRVRDDDYEIESAPAPQQYQRRKVGSAPSNSVEEKEVMKGDRSPPHKTTIVEYDRDEEVMTASEDVGAVRYASDDSNRQQTLEEEKEKSEEVEEEEEEVPMRGINACPVKNEVIAPYWANNTRGETLALLNVHPFEQYVHFEKCASEHRQMLCRAGCRCEQQFRLHRLLAFDPRNECRGVFSDWFRFPSCCVCVCYGLAPDLP